MILHPSAPLIIQTSASWHELRRVKSLPELDHHKNGYRSGFLFQKPIKQKCHAEGTQENTLKYPERLNIVEPSGTIYLSNPGEEAVNLNSEARGNTWCYKSDNCPIHPQTRLYVMYIFFREHRADGVSIAARLSIWIRKVLFSNFGSDIEHDCVISCFSSVFSDKCGGNIAN
jgi:hypothetical protein